MLKINSSIYMKKTKAPLKPGDLVVVCKGRWNDRVKKATADDAKRVVGVYIGKVTKNKHEIANDFEYHTGVDPYDYKL